MATRAQIETESRSREFYLQGKRIEDFDLLHLADRPVFIIGGGPSLYDFEFASLRGHNVIGINRAYEYYADGILFFMDFSFYQDNRNKPVWEMFRGPKVGPSPLAANQFYDRPDTYMFWRRMVPQVTLSLKDGVYCGSNSGLGAMLFAVACGCNPIYLLGYDLKVKSGNFGSHWHGGYGEKSSKNLDLRIEEYRREIEDLGLQAQELGVKIINLSPDSALQIFPRMRAEEVLHVS